MIILGLAGLASYSSEVRASPADLSAMFYD
jgi:hypothetical protein